MMKEKKNNSHTSERIQIQPHVQKHNVQSFVAFMFGWRTENCIKLAFKWISFESGFACGTIFAFYLFVHIDFNVSIVFTMALLLNSFLRSSSAE